MEFIGATSAGTVRIHVYIFLDKSGQYFCRYSLLYCDSFVSNDLFASVSCRVFFSLCTQERRRSREGIGARYIKSITRMRPSMYMNTDKRQQTFQDLVDNPKKMPALQ